MSSNDIVMPIVGIVLCVTGYLLITKEKVARWGLSHGSARIWVTLLGMERAIKLTKYFFGPITSLAGIICILGYAAEHFHLI